MHSNRTLLRAATQAAHARLDTVFSRYDLACPAGYRRFLLAQAAVVPSLEAALDGALDGAGARRVLPDWPERRRSAALLADLATLGVARPPALRAPAPGGPGWVLGALYVLEGSRLGAKMLRRRVMSGGDVLCCAATAYLTHEPGSASWPDFLAVLQTSPHAADLDTMVLGACDIFALFEQAACSPDHEEVSAHAESG